MQPNEHLVRQYAYQNWDSEGRPNGQAMRHWEMACMLAEGQTGPADPMEPLTRETSNSAARPSGTASTSKRKKAPSAAGKKNLTGPAEQEVTMASADPRLNTRGS